MVVTHVEVSRGISSCCRSAVSSNHSQESLLPLSIYIYIYIYIYILILIVSFCYMEYSVLLEFLVCLETGTISEVATYF
jgi:hypothetical protein